MNQTSISNSHFPTSSFVNKSYAPDVPLCCLESIDAVVLACTLDSTDVDQYKYSVSGNVNDFQNVVCCRLASRFKTINNTLHKICVSFCGTLSTLLEAGRLNENICKQQRMQFTATTRTFSELNYLTFFNHHGYELHFYYK